MFTAEKYPSYVGSTLKMLHVNSFCDELLPLTIPVCVSNTSPLCIPLTHDLSLADRSSSDNIFSYLSI